MLDIDWINNSLAGKCCGNQYCTMPQKKTLSIWKSTFWTTEAWEGREGDNDCNAPISVKPVGGGGRGRAWGGDLTFFTNLLSNSLPAGKSFQSNATKFPHPGLHIATKYTKAEPKKGTMKIDFVSLYFRLLWYHSILFHTNVIVPFITIKVWGWYGNQ